MDEDDLKDFEETIRRDRKGSTRPNLWRMLMMLSGSPRRDFSSNNRIV